MPSTDKDATTTPATGETRPPGSHAAHLVTSGTVPIPTGDAWLPCIRRSGAGLCLRWRSACLDFIVYVARRIGQTSYAAPAWVANHTTPGNICTSCQKQLVRAQLRRRFQYWGAAGERTSGA